MNQPNPMFAKFDKVLGVTTPTSPTGALSRADQILQMESAPQKTETQNPGYLENVANDFKAGVAKGSEAYSRSITGEENPIRSGVEMAAGTADAIASPINEGIKSLASEVPYSKEIGNSASSALSWLGDKLGDTPAFEAVAKVLNDHPDVASTIGDLISTAGNVATISGANEITPKVLNDIPTAGITPLKTAVSDTAGTVKKAVLNPVKTVAKAIAKKTAIKSEADILATKPEDVYKLNSVDRGIYKDLQNANQSSEHATQLADLKKQNALDTSLTEEQKAKSLADLKTKQASEIDTTTQQHKAIEQNVKDTMAQKVNDSDVEIEKLKKDYETGVLKTTTEARPQILKAFKNQSDIYSEKAEEALAKAPNKGNTPINTKNISALSDKIDILFKDDPTGTMAKQMKDGLGLEETPNFGNAKVTGGEVPSTLTPRELYNRIKEMRQMYSQSAKSGGKVFSSDEYNLSKVLNEASDVMKKGGVDMSDANSFWRKWAGQRDKTLFQTPVNLVEKE